MKYLNVALKNEWAKSIADNLSKGTAKERQGKSESIRIYEFYAQVKGEKCKMVMTSVRDHLGDYDFVNPCPWKDGDQAYLFDEPVERKCDEDFRRTLQSEVRRCQGLIIWTREGENIGIEIIEVCRTTKPNIKVHRAAIFSEITLASVERALEQLVEDDQWESYAENVRCVMDFLTGIVFTRLQSYYLQERYKTKFPNNHAIKYGSCLIPALGFVAERYKAVEEAFYSTGQQFDPTAIRLTEAGLIDLMQKHGIGTDNTYVGHINTVKVEGYIGVLYEGFLVPGIIGMCLYEGYEAMGLPLAKPNLRAEFAADLKRICEGEKEPHVVLREQKEKYKEFYKQMADNISLLDVALKRSFSRFPCLNFPNSKNLGPQEKCRSCNSSTVKVVKFCSASVYYKSLCNATSGWYQTWLHDDGTLRDSINFNLMQSVPSGRVVSDTQDSGVMLGTASGSSDPSSGGFGNMDYNQTATQLTFDRPNMGRVFYRCNSSIVPLNYFAIDPTLPGEICGICSNPVMMVKFCSANNYYNYLSIAPNGWY